MQFLRKNIFVRNWLKKKRPMLFTELNSGDGQDAPVEEQFPDERSNNLLDQIIDQKETKRLIREIIEELPEDQRAVIGMFYYEEMSVKELECKQLRAGRGCSGHILLSCNDFKIRYAMGGDL